jgi:DNA modification methylase
MTATHPLTTTAFPLNELTTYHRNPRRGNVPAIAASLQTIGQYRPIVVNLGRLTGRPLEVLAGNHTLLAARHLGWDTITGATVDVDDETAARIVAADNRTADLGDYDLAQLLELLADLPDLTGTGYTDDDLAKLTADLAPDPAPIADPDAVPEVPAEPRSVLGDVWVLGPHRVVCGDSTDAGVHDALMEGERAACIWTDPPYGVSYVGGTKDALTIQNDALDVPKLTDFLRAALSAALASTKPGAVWYVASPTRQPMAAFALTLAELEVWHSTIVWVKDSLVLGRGDYHSRHEVLFYGWTPGAARLHPVEDRTQDDVWEIPGPKVNADHPTMKPVALVERVLANSTSRGDTVLDPFGGSGSTLIACHQTGRVARLIELDPRYVDVICRRYQEGTGTLPVLESTGEAVDFTQPAEAA